MERDVFATVKLLSSRVAGAPPTQALLSIYVFKAYGSAMRPKQNLQQVPNKGNGYVTANVVAQRYGVTGRYILQLAAAGTIPSLRLGKKCVRFNLEAVAAALEGGR